MAKRKTLADVWELISIKGAEHKLAKLTQDQARKVREIHKTGLTFVQIGKMFNIHANNISRIVKMRGYVEGRV